MHSVLSELTVNVLSAGEHLVGVDGRDVSREYFLLAQKRREELAVVNLAHALVAADAEDQYHAQDEWDYCDPGDNSYYSGDASTHYPHTDEEWTDDDSDPDWSPIFRIVRVLTRITNGVERCARTSPNPNFGKRKRPCAPTTQNTTHCTHSTLKHVMRLSKQRLHVASTPQSFQWKHSVI